LTNYKVPLIASFIFVISKMAPPYSSWAPFAFLWNSPSSSCAKHYSVPLDLSLFAAVSDPSNNVVKQNLTLFYDTRLGHYPYITEDKNETIKYNGAIPQNTTLRDHLRQATVDITHYLPNKEAKGLAVIDWEEWMPLWYRNTDKKKIYRKLSVEHLRRHNPTETFATIKEKAIIQFETAAREFMKKTLQLGKYLRPNQLWGFYMFPECYNHYRNENIQYTGKCTERDVSLNNKLIWLWEESTALYPSIYFTQHLSNTTSAALFVRHRILEAMRVAELSKKPVPAPVYAYQRLVFSDNTTAFLSQVDLIHSIGESAALGAAGIILWGASTMDSYLTSTLNPYIVNVTEATKLCSQILCHNNGRCIRKKLDSSDYLHLNPTNFHIQMNQHGQFISTGVPSKADLMYMVDKFTCQYYYKPRSSYCEAAALALCHHAAP
uniref:Hyaluronidase n=1 Tax=Erpetoichthys calabaricus TaxID=27687 RepID=A0A8C4RMF1_ERPCA